MYEFGKAVDHFHCIPHSFFPSQLSFLKMENEVNPPN